MGKLVHLLFIAAIVLGLTTPVMAEFAQLQLIRVVYHLTGSVEVAASLGNVKDLITQSNASVGGGDAAFSLTQFPGADWSDLYVAYFAMDYTAQDAWTSGPEDNQTSGNRQFGPFYSASSMIFGYYDTLESSGGAVIAQQSWPNSYWSTMDSSGISRGGFKTFIPKMNGEHNLTDLDEAGGGSGYVDQVLYFYDTPNAVAKGVRVATLRTMADGTTLINPPQHALPQVNLMVLDAKATEGTPVTDTGSFRITRTGDLSQPLAIKMQSSGTATAGADYQSLPTSVTIPSGSASIDVLVTPIDDGVLETTETVILSILADSAYELGPSATGTVAIDDNEPQLPVVTLKVLDGIATEGTPVTDKAKFRITRTGDLSQPLTVRFKLSGTAKNGTDYKKLSTKLTIPANESKKDLTVIPVDDISVETTETVVLTILANAAYELGATVSGTVEIDDNEPDLPVVSLELPDGKAMEGTPVKNKAKLRVTRTGDLTESLIVKIEVSGGTATVKTDYKKLPVSVTIAAGEVSKDFVLTPVDDSAQEDVETVIVALVESPEYTLGTSVQKTLKILDND